MSGEHVIPVARGRVRELERLGYRVIGSPGDERGEFLVFMEGPALPEAAWRRLGEIVADLAAGKAAEA